MPDITMCNNDECPRAKECYRHEATPSPYAQTYTRFIHNRNGCSAFMEIWVKGKKQEPKE
jgi:hypothetical protein